MVCAILKARNYGHVTLAYKTVEKIVESKEKSEMEEGGRGGREAEARRGSWERREESQFLSLQRKEGKRQGENRKKKLKFSPLRNGSH